MSILTRDSLVSLTGDQTLCFEPAVPDSAIGPASVDLALGNNFWIPRSARGSDPGAVDVSLNPTTVRSAIYDMVHRETGETFYLEAGGRVVCATLEKLTLPSSVCGWLTGRGWVLRLCTELRISHAFVQPGIIKKSLYFVVSNLGGRTINLHPGERICQVVLMRTEGAAQYLGEGTFATT